MEILKSALEYPILALIIGWITYVGYVLKQNYKLRKDLQLRDILNDINKSQKKNDDLELSSLVKLSHERKLRRHEAGRDPEVK